MTVLNDIDDDSATKHSDFHTSDAAFGWSPTQRRTLQELFWMARRAVHPPPLLLGPSRFISSLRNCA